jgi:hydrogenase expression/formation protein HypE
MSHGAGGRLSAKLFEEVFAKHYPSPELMARSDSAVLDWGSDDRLALSTDAFVIQPLMFPGGDIGSLSVYGTVNDLAVQGAKPIALTIAWILEEGFPMSDLHRLASSIGHAASECSVRIVAGDTKVVERGRGHGCYITTSGIGRIDKSLDLHPKRIRSGDCVLISGPIGDHGMAIMSQRAGLVFEPTLKSDCAPRRNAQRTCGQQRTGLRDRGVQRSDSTASQIGLRTAWTRSLDRGQRGKTCGSGA